MKEFYNKYKNYIVIALFGLFCFKSCQSCFRSRTIRYNDMKYQKIVDSLKNEIKQKETEIDSLIFDNNAYKITILNNAIDQYKASNKSLEEANEHYRNANRVLVNTNNQIINKEKE